MKLSEIAIDGYGIFRGLNLGRFNDGLNFVYGENGAGKTTIRKFLQGVLFGFDNDSHPLTGITSSGSPGRIGVRQGFNEYSLARDARESNLGRQLKINGASISGSDGFASLSHLAGDISHDLYESVFSFSLRDTIQNARRLASVLHNQLSVPRGPSAIGDDSAHRDWQRELESRQAKLIALRQKATELAAEKSNCQNEIQSANTIHRSRLADLENQIRLAASHISQTGLQQKRNELVALDQEINQLRAVIDSAFKQVTYVPTMPENDPFAALYQRLDEIDLQIRRWRRVQSDIQNQRVRLKDEMLVWNDLTLDSDEHPYHNAQGILFALENKIDQTEKKCADWTKPTQQGDPGQLVRSIQDLCGQMRDDLYGLCQELAQQYKHIRHKAAAAELKQLRRCYNEMGENTQRLVQRRDALIKEIRKVDPAGAEAIERSEAGFCQCAMHEGYLQARKKHVAGSPESVPSQLTHQIVSPDLTAERRRLDSLHQQRQQLVSLLANADGELATWRTRHAELVRQRDSLRLIPESSELEAKIRNIESELNRLHQEISTLAQLVERDRGYLAPEPNRILIQAAKHLHRVTNGELTQVYLSEVTDVSDFQTRNRIGNILNFSALDSEQQDLVYLCVAIAVTDELQTKSIQYPIVIDDAFANIHRDRVNAVLELLMHQCTAGHQIVVLTQHQYLADRVPGTPVLELPPNSFPSPITQPDRAPSIPVTPARGTTYLAPPMESENWDEIEPKHQVSTYPFSKYLSPPATEYSQPANPFTSQPVDSRREEAEYSNSYAKPYGAQPFSPISVDSAGDPLGYVAGVDGATSLERIDLVEIHQLRALAEAGIESVSDLLNVDPYDLPQNLIEQGVSYEQVDRWQSQLWLLSNVPGLRVIDAKLLVACGVSEPEHLATSHAQLMFERIQRFLGSSEGQRFVSAVNSISLQRINGWYQSLDSTRSQWSLSNGFSRRAKNRDHNSNRQPRSANWDRANESNGRGPRLLREGSSNRATASRNRPPVSDPQVARPPRMKTPDRPSPAPALPPVQRNARNSVLGSTTAGQSKLRFYLNLNDHIEAAPSIGPKTAERFEKIGVAAVGDFLKQTAESMAAKLNYKRITADLVRAWQHQARLVCRIPNLRGHDAQLLVACGYTEAEEIATLQPQNLFDVIGPFSDTKDGLKIIRTGKKPDLKEVSDWISWAGKTRSLQAA